MTTRTQKPTPTPTPWQVFNGTQVINAEGRTIADCQTTRSIPGMDADAALIVRAVNSYAQMLHALNTIACWDDKAADEHLSKTGSYSLFDEPASVQVARATLSTLAERKP